MLLLFLPFFHSPCSFARLLIRSIVWFKSSTLSQWNFENEDNKLQLQPTKHSHDSPNGIEHCSLHPLPNKVHVTKLCYRILVGSGAMIFSPAAPRAINTQWPIRVHSIISISVHIYIHLLDTLALHVFIITYNATFETFIIVCTSQHHLMHILCTLGKLTIE